MHDVSISPILSSTVNPIIAKSIGKLTAVKLCSLFNHCSVNPSFLFRPNLIFIQCDIPHSEFLILSKNRYSAFSADDIGFLLFFLFFLNGH